MNARLMEAALNLAKCIFYARAQAFDVDELHWDALQPKQKHIWIDQAQRIILANRPPLQSPALFDSFAALTRQHFGASK